MRTMYLALAAMVTLAACSDSNGGYNTAGLDGGSGWNDNEISSEDLNDPTSVAYFQNAVGDTVLFDVDEFTLNTASKAARPLLRPSASTLDLRSAPSGSGSVSGRNRRQKYQNSFGSSGPRVLPKSEKNLSLYSENAHNSFR